MNYASALQPTKRTVSEGVHDLAVFGGQPAFAHPLHVGRPNLGDRESLLARVTGALDRRWLTNAGPLVEEFERQVAAVTGVAHCVAVSSATVGLQLVARALGLTGEVIMPSFTFVGSAHAFQWLGLDPVFCEIDERSQMLSPSAVEAAITARTSAIVGVHLWGRACEVDPLAHVARRHGLALIFDAAHATGCTHHGVFIGRFGDAEVFSFHATKVASAGEGGAITTNDASLADRLRLMRNFGFADYDTVVTAGTNAKMSELSAALGVTSLDSLGEFVEVNRRNYRRYELELGGIPGVALVSHGAGERSNYHYVVAEIDPRATGLSRDDLVTVLHAENVLARRYFYPGCHRLAPYRDAGASLPVTEEVSERVIVLPTGTAVEPKDISMIAAIIRAAAADGEQLRRRLDGAVSSGTASAAPGPRR